MTTNRHTVVNVSVDAVCHLRAFPDGPDATVRGTVEFHQTGV